MPGRRRKKQRLERKAGGEGDAPSGEIARRDAEPETPGPSVYLVVTHGYYNTTAAYSVFKVDPHADGGGGDPVRIPRRLARLWCDADKSFVSVRRGGGGGSSWIVGVGGTSVEDDYGPETIVFDAETRAVFPGPNPGSTKRCPVLLAVGDRIYAMARTPSVNARVDEHGRSDGRIDFLPWFEVLDLSRSEVTGGRLAGCEWRPLPRPPFFPWELTPDQYRRDGGPLKFGVSSYAAVGSHILVSVVGSLARPGTHAFDTETERWATVDDEKSLPFARAIPHGHELFLGVSRGTGAVTAYKINLVAGPKPSLSIVEVPVFSDQLDEEVDHWSFVSLGTIDRGFCTFRSWNVEDRPLGYADLSPCRRAHIRVRRYGMHDFEGACFDLNKEWTHVYKIQDLIRRLDEPCLQHVFAI